MEKSLIAISVVLTLASALPYIRDVIKGRTKPRVISWLNWSFLAAIAAFASFSDHQYPAAIMSFCAAIECIAVVILGWKKGDRHLESVDYISQIGVIVALVLWWIYNSAAVAIIAVITIDLIASLPTIKHAWQKPFEETWLTFLGSGLGAFFIILAAEEAKITSLANPIYIALINFTIMTIILTKRKAVHA